MIRAVLLISILVAACGGSKSEPTATPPATADKGHDEHGTMPVEVKAFHDVFAPKYHAAKGPDRMKNTCAAIPDFTSGAAAIAKATPPAGVDATTWNDATGKLAASIEGLDTTCKANDAAAFEPAFETMHDNFHGVMEAAGGHHEGAMKPEGAAMKPEGGGY